MELLRSSRPNRKKFIAVVIRPASKPLLSPLDSLERGACRLRMVDLRCLPEEYTVTRMALPGIGARRRSYES